MRTPEWTGEDARLMAHGKIAPFLWKLHAVRYPDRHPRTMWLGHGQLLEGWIESPGAVMLAPELTVRQKAAALKVDFRPIGAWVDRQTPARTERAARFAEFCVANAVQADLVPLLDEEGRTCTAGSLLPPPETVDALFVNWIDHHASRSLRAERFIGDSLLRAGMAAEA